MTIQECKRVKRKEKGVGEGRNQKRINEERDAFNSVLSFERDFMKIGLFDSPFLPATTTPTVDCVLH